MSAQILDSTRNPLLSVPAAITYAKIWTDPSYVVRRVDTVRIVNSKNILKNATFDISNSDLYEGLSKIRKTIRGRKKASIHLPVPLLMLPQAPLFDLSASDASGTKLHTCRKSVNISVSAHIIVGMCLQFIPAIKNLGNLFDVSVKFLRNPNHQTEKAVRVCIQKFSKPELKEEESKLMEEVSKLLDKLKSNFIACISLPIINTDEVSIVKVVFDDFMSEHDGFYDASRPNRRPLLTPPENSSGPPMSKHDLPHLPEQYVAKNTFKGKLTHATQLCGIRAPRFKFPGGPIGLGRYTTHLRLVAPEGTRIDDCRVHRWRNEGRSSEDFTQREIVPTSNFFISFNDERALIFDREYVKDDADIIVKLNPKRTLFHFPAILTSFVLVILLSLLLHFGPMSSPDQASGFAAALFLLPSVSVLFVANSTENEMISRTLGWNRLFLTISLIMSVITGGLLVLSQIGEDHPLVKTDAPLIHSISFWFVLLTLIYNYSILVIFTLGVFRIDRMRRIVGQRTLNEKEALKRNAAAESTGKESKEDAKVYKRFRRHYIYFRTVWQLILVASLVFAVWYICGNYQAWHDNWSTLPFMTHIMDLLDTYISIIVRI